MPKFAANLSMMYTEHAFLDRFAAAAADGFDAVEFLFPYDHPPAEIAAGDVAMKLRRYLPPGRVGHIQIAGIPERHEPDSGELRYAYIFDVLDELGWQGHLGCEYRPRAGTTAGLGGFAPYRPS